MRRHILLLAVSVGALTSAAILSGYVMVGRGDPANRVITSFAASADLTGFASKWVNWSGTWPAAYFLIQGAWIRILEAFGVESMLPVIQAVLWLSVVSWVLVLLGSYSVMKRAVGVEWGWLTVAGLLALPLLTELSHNAYASIYFAALFVFGLRALIEFEVTQQLVWLALAGLALLLGSTLRTEAIIASFGLAFILWLRHGLLRASVFFVLASSLTLTRGLVVLWVGEDTARFFQQVPQPMGARLVELVTLGLYLLVPTGIVLALLQRHFGSRLSGEVLTGDSPRVRLAEYAGASALALYAFFFASMLLLPMLGPDARFLLVPSVATIIALACLATIPAGDVWGRMRRWLAPWVIVSCLVQVFLLGVDYLTDTPRTVPEIRDAAALLRERTGARSLVAIDHLYWWEQTLLLYGSSSPEALRSSYVFSVAPPVEDFRPQPTNAVEAAGAYLAMYRPRYLVMQGPEAGRLRGSVGSFLDPWVARVGDRVAVTPFGSQDPAATAVSVARNDWVEILELDWTAER